MNIPSKLVLTCTVTGKVVTWTNKAIIQKKIEEFGSLDAFVKQFKCKGAGKDNTNESVSSAKPIKVLKPILEEGVAIGKMTLKEYQDKYLEKVFTYSDGTSCTVVTSKWYPPTEYLDPF